MSITKKCTKVNELPGYEEAKLWWRSRTPQERDSGISYNLDGLTPIRSIVIPKPFQGRIKVFVTSHRSYRERIINVSKRQLDSLRRLFLMPNHKGWRLLEKTDRVVFTRGGEIHLWEELHSLDGL